MNYREINQAIIEGRDIDETKVTKDDRFYRYLLNNKVAYYYCSFLSTSPNETEDMIMARHAAYSAKYSKSMRVLHSTLDSAGIPYLLYKTHKFFPDTPDGDIDFIVHANDFHNCLKVFNEHGFNTEEDEPGKGKCVKKGYCVLEPHTSVSWRGSSAIDGPLLWQDSYAVHSDGHNFFNVSLGIEYLSTGARILFEPAYLDLYSLMTMRKLRQLNPEIVSYAPRIKFLRQLVSVNAIMLDRAIVTKHKFPLFLPFKLYLWYSINTHILSGRISIFLKHMTYYSYWRIRYQTFNKLPFTHHDQ